MLDGLVVGHETGPRREVGDEAVEPAFDEAFSYSDRRQASEQYTLPSVCLSQARQKSGDQSISKDIVIRRRALRIGKTSKLLWDEFSRRKRTGLFLKEEIRSKNDVVSMSYASPVR